MTPNIPQDELLQRYAQAQAALPDGLPDQPSTALHERIMQAAYQQANAIHLIAPRAVSMPANDSKGIENKVEKQILTAEAANDSFWNIRALGSLAVMGLAGLLWWQFEHGTPDEQEAARSAQPNSAVIATAPVTMSATASTSASIPATESPALLTPPLPPAAHAPTKLAQAKSATQSSSNELAAVNTPSSAREPSPAPAAPAPQIPAPSAAQPAAASAPAPMVRPLPQVEKASANASMSGVHDAAPYTSSASSAPSPAAAAPRIMAAPAPAARALIASPDKLFQAIEAKDTVALRQAIAQGASPNANTRHTPEGHTALQQAVIQRWAEGVRILLAAGANKEARNSKGHTAADMALELGYADMTELLAMPR